MNTNSSSAEGGGKAPRVLGQLQGIALFATVLLPVVAAYFVYYTGLGMPEGKINQGELLQPPVNIFPFQFREGDGAPLRLADDERQKWRYFILPGAACGDDCEQLLYISRQVHIRLGDKANRVERFLVTSAPLPKAQQRKLQREHPRLRTVWLEENALRELYRQTEHNNIADPRLLLVDQQGFAMMAYDKHHSGNQLLKDIKRLLKYSYEK